MIGVSHHDDQELFAGQKRLFLLYPQFFGGVILSINTEKYQFVTEILGFFVLVPR